MSVKNLLTELRDLKKSGIYKIISPSKRIYIGQSIDLYRRLKEYNYFKYKNTYTEQRKLFNSFHKYGVLNHIFEIIEYCEKKLLNEKEVYWIRYYNSYKNGLNSCEGGCNHYIISEEWKRGASKRVKKLWENPDYRKKNGWTKERREKMRQSLEERKKRGCGLSNLGNKASKESREKMRMSHLGHIPANKGKPLSEKTKQRLREINTGKKQSKETIEKRIEKIIKLSKEDVLKIMKLIDKENITSVAISKLFNISPVIIQKIKKRNPKIYYSRYYELHDKNKRKTICY